MKGRESGKARRLLLAALAVKFAFLCPPLTAAGAERIELAGEMMAPRFLEGGSASESWSYVFRFPESGYTVFSQFMISNAGPGKHRATVVGILVAPDGRRALIKNGRARDKWSYLPGEKGPELRIAKHILRMTPDSHSLHMENSRGTVTIDSVSLSDPFFPPPLELRDGASLERIILAPRMEVTGTAAFPGEEPVDLGRGRGVAYLERSPVADHDRMVSRLMFHTFSGEVELSILEFRGTGKDDYRSSALLLLMKEGDVVFHDSSAAVEFSSFSRDGTAPNYLIPGAFRFTGSSGGKSVEGEVDLSITWRYDWLEALDNPIAKFYLGRFSHPIQYEHQATCRLEVDLDGISDTIDTSGVAVLHILNPPNW